MFKTKEEIIIIQAETKEPIHTRAVFWSHDKGTAKMLFKLRKDGTSQSLAEGTIVPVVLDFNSDTAENGRGRHIYHAVIEDAVNGIVSIVLEGNILGYQGRVDGSIYIELPDSRSLDTAGRFTFHIKRSPIDEDVPELEDYYWQGFSDIMEQYHESIAEIKLEAKTTLDSLTADVTAAQNKVTQLEQSITTANTNLNTRIDEINKKIDDNDVFTKAESSANVIDQISGTESTIFKKDLLVDGSIGTAQRYVKDLGNENLLGSLKSTRYTYNAESNILVASGATAGTKLSEVYLQTGEYTVSLKLISKPSLNTSFTTYLDGAEQPSISFTSFNNFNLNQVYARKITLTQASKFSSFCWGNAKNETFEFEMKLEKDAYTSFTPAPEWYGVGEGLTPINGGMVPFRAIDYETLNTPNELVKAETKVDGRGAEIETAFKVIQPFVERYPFLFENLTIDAEKLAHFKEICHSLTVKGTLRGSGANNSKYGQLYLKHTDGTSEFLVSNQTSEFVEISKTLTATQLDQLSSTGVLTVYATTKRNGTNGTNDAGAISDGVTSALLEVKDLRLVVEIEANGKTIIESIIAQNHVTNLATQTEATTATDNTKTMTPLRTKQLLDSKLLNMVYPIGSIYMSVNSATPATLFGGTWERFSKGRVLVGVDEDDEALKTVGTNGGSTNPLTAHTHTTQLTTYRVTSAGSGAVNNLARSTDQGNAMTGEFGSVTSTGDNTDHKNWQPFTTVYMWKRTA